MLSLSGPQLEDLAYRILCGADVSEAHARVIAVELRDANLVGHDSHGVMRLVQYVQMIRDGFVKPDGAFEVVLDTPALCVCDGHFNFGQVAATEALQIAQDKARQVGCATVFVRNCNHVGRLGSYTQKAADAGFAAMMAVNAPGPGGVAPFGGMERRLGTNPISMAAPSTAGPLVLDMTTSATAEGKLRVAHQKGEEVPEGWIIDGTGEPSTNPADYYNEPYGAILPLGGTLGYKCFGMSVMIDVFCGMLSGSGVCRTDLPRGANGVWLYLVDIKQLVGDDEYSSLMATYVDYIKGAKRLPGVDEILLPGEIENRRNTLRERDGVPIPDETWRQITELASELNVNVDDLAG